MANVLYPLTKQAWLASTSGYNLDQNTVNDGPYVALIDTGTYTYSALHDFYNDLSGIGGTPMRITSPTIVGGLFTGGNVTFAAVAGIVTYEALVIYRHNTGANTTWPLIAFIDTGVSGLPVTSNGGDIVVTWSASGIFQL